MAILLTCPYCTGVINASDNAVGRRVSCPHCRTPFLVPGRRLGGGLGWAAIGPVAVVVLALVAGGALVLGHRMGRSKDKSEIGAAEAHAQGLSQRLSEAEAVSRKAAEASNTEREDFIAKLVDRDGKLADAKKREDASTVAMRELDGKLKAALGVAALGNRRESEMAEDAYFRDLRKFQGSWKPTKFIVNNEDIGPTVAGYEFECRFDKLVSPADGPTGEISLRPGTTPPQIDLKPGKNFNNGKLIEGIYSFEGEVMILCFARNGEARPVRFDAGNTVALLHLSKVVKK